MLDVEDFKNSPSIVLRQLELKEREKIVDIELKKEDHDFEHKYIWRSCICNETDSRLLKFIATMGLLLLISGFSFYMLLTVSPCDGAPYISILSGIVGVLLPQPSIMS